MKLSVSNIAWEPDRTREFLGVLRQEGCQALEFCPSMIWKEPTTATSQEIKSFDQLVRSFGLEFSSMHSLTYPHPEMTFFETESRKKLVSYIVGLSQLANTLKIPVMVFGGKSRMIGPRDRQECFKILEDTCREIAEKISSSGVILLMEPLSKLDIDAINDAEEAMELIRRVNHKNFALHIDLKSSFAQQEDQDIIWPKYVSYIKHCHVSDPGLKPPSTNCPQHLVAAKAIKKSGYDRYISLEISRVPDVNVLKEAISFVKKVYLYHCEERSDEAIF